MKKLTLLLSMFLSAGMMTAQTADFGVKAGVNFANVTGDVNDTEMRTGYHLGLVAEIMITDKFSFQPEVLYSAQGAKEEETETYMGNEFSYEEKLNLDYINVPLMAKYYFTPGLSFEAGPQIGFLVKSESEYKYSGGGESESGKEDMKEYTKNVDFAIAGGLSYKLPSGVFFSGRYNLGLSNLADDMEDEDFELKNNVIQLSVGFLF